MTLIRRAVLALFAIVSGAGPASAQAPPPVPGLPYQYWDVLQIDGMERKVYFRNDSPAPITITQVVIDRCNNTRQSCGTYPANLVVQPGKTVVAFKVEQLDKKLSWSYGYKIRTKGESTQPTVTIGAPPGGAVMRGADGSLIGTMQAVSIDSLAPTVAALTDGGACGSMSMPDLPAGHKLLLMIFGTTSQPTARRVMVRLDANGSAYEYIDFRRDPNDAAPDPRSSQITLDLVRQSAIVRNSGGGQSPTFFRATGATLLTAASLGKPGETIAKIVKECGGS